MRALRGLLLRHRMLAAWLVLLALAMRLLVPPGYMIGGAAAGSMSIEPCSGVSPLVMAMTEPVIAHHDHHHEDRSGHEQPCAFAGLAMASLAGTDAPQLATAGLFVVVATAFPILVLGRLSTPPFLRPPLRGPPVR